MAAFHSMFHRLYNVPMSRIAFQKEEEYIYETAHINGYKKEEIRVIQKKHEKKIQEQKITLTREQSSAERGDGKMMILNRQKSQHQLRLQNSRDPRRFSNKS
jgi:hypothetical protein